jgi:acetate kinase
MSMAAPLLGVINAGSSSLKFAVYEGERLLLSGQVDGIGVHPGIRVSAACGRALQPLAIADAMPKSPADVLPLLLPWLRERLDGRPLAALGHRVVHGGAAHARPARVTPELLRELSDLEPLAPLHEPYNLAPMRMALEHAPDLPQVACFDTAFHHTVPEVAQTFAIPRALTAKGIRRYGFHGLSYEYIASVLPTEAPEIAGGRIVAAHLGNGASLCALRDGQSVATTMGFSALDGLPMGTRCGELDAAVVLFLLEHEGMSPSSVSDLLYRQSGMLGVSGVSSDFRDLIASTDPNARFALKLFVYRVARSIGSLAAATGGLDGIVFTAGVGENAAPVRAAICEACVWLGVELDPDANASHGPRISRRGARTAAYVIPTNENLMIARHTRAVIAEGW